jgi:hypothetical protein
VSKWRKQQRNPEAHTLHFLKFAAVVSAALLTGLTLQAADASAEILISSAV